MITHRRPRETWQQREDRYRHQQEDYRREEERRRQEWNRHRDHWNCPFLIHCWEENIKLPTVRDCPECNGYDRYDRSNRQYQNNNRRFHGPIRRERRFMIGLGAGSVCTTGLVIMLNIFPGTRKNLKKWLMHGFLMSSYFAWTLILIEWSRGKIVAHR